MKVETIECHGCTTIFKKRDDVEQYATTGVGRYGVAIPECLAQFFEVLNKEQELFGYPPAHRLIVDAYSVQHPPNLPFQKELGIEQRLIDASIQSVVVHLLGLYFALEKKTDLHAIAKKMDQLLKAERAGGFSFKLLQPSQDLGAMNVTSVHDIFLNQDLSLEEYTNLAYDWGRDAWEAWSDHHEYIRKLHNE